MSRDDEWERTVRRCPTPAEVVKLNESLGFEICCERWSHLSPRTIGELLAKGRRLRMKKD